jgi:cell wall-associated NlpC family hydrolase
MSATPMRVIAPSVFLYGRPDASAEALTELLFGEDVLVSFSRADWAEIESLTDGYRGFVPVAALGEKGPEASHRGAALRTLVYPEPNLKVRAIATLSFMSKVRCGGERNGFVELADGAWVHTDHLTPVDKIEPDYPRTAMRFLETPYLWGGRTSLGLDCSALVQLSLAAAGIAAPRDSGPQRAALGHRVLGDAPPRHGDLVFWPGHVGIVAESGLIVHANAYQMAVGLEPLEAINLRVGQRAEARRL